MTAPYWKPGDKVFVCYPSWHIHDSAEAVVIGPGYDSTQCRVQYRDGKREIVSTIYLYHLEEAIHPRYDVHAPDTPGRPRKSGEAKAPRKRQAKRGVTGKRRQQVKDILRLAMQRRLETSTTPKRWED